MRSGMSAALRSAQRCPPRRGETAATDTSGGRRRDRGPAPARRRARATCAARPRPAARENAPRAPPHPGRGGGSPHTAPGPARNDPAFRSGLRLVGNGTARDTLLIYGTSDAHALTLGVPGGNPQPNRRERTNTATQRARPDRARASEVIDHQSSRTSSSYSMHSMQNELGALGTMRRGGW